MKLNKKYLTYLSGLTSLLLGAGMFYYLHNTTNIPSIKKYNKNVSIFKSNEKDIKMNYETALSLAFKNPNEITGLTLYEANDNITFHNNILYKLEFLQIENTNNFRPVILVIKDNKVINKIEFLKETEENFKNTINLDKNKTVVTNAIKVLAKTIDNKDYLFLINSYSVFNKKDETTTQDNINNNTNSNKNNLEEPVDLGTAANDSNTLLDNHLEISNEYIGFIVYEINNPNEIKFNKAYYFEGNYNGIRLTKNNEIIVRTNQIDKDYKEFKENNDEKIDYTPSYYIYSNNNITKKETKNVYYNEESYSPLYSMFYVINVKDNNIKHFAFMENIEKFYVEDNNIYLLSNKMQILDNVKIQNKDPREASMNGVQSNAYFYKINKKNLKIENMKKLNGYVDLDNNVIFTEDNIYAIAIQYDYSEKPTSEFTLYKFDKKLNIKEENKVELKDTIKSIKLIDNYIAITYFNNKYGIDFLNLANKKILHLDNTNINAYIYKLSNGKVAIVSNTYENMLKDDVRQDIIFGYIPKGIQVDLIELKDNIIEKATLKLKSEESLIEKSNLLFDNDKLYILMNNSKDKEIALQEITFENNIENKNKIYYQDMIQKELNKGIENYFFITQLIKFEDSIYTYIEAYSNELKEGVKTLIFKK